MRATQQGVAYLLMFTNDDVHEYHIRFMNIRLMLMNIRIKDPDIHEPDVIFMSIRGHRSARQSVHLMLMNISGALIFMKISMKKSDVHENQEVFFIK